MRPSPRPHSPRAGAVPSGPAARLPGCRAALRLAAAALSLLCLGAAAPAPAAPRIRCLTSNGVRYLYLADIAAAYGMRYEAASSRFVLRSASARAVFVVDETEAVLNGTRVYLSDAPWVARGQAVVAEVDYRLLLAPILKGSGLRPSRVRRVLIDPGHGGKDPGTSRGTTREKEITLQVARRLQKELAARGYLVALTRTRDADLALSSRPEKARTWKADVMVSLHCNAAGAGIRGIESFRTPPVGARSTYGMQRATTSCANNAWDANNARLAYEVQRAAVASAGAVDRGVRNARFVVTRNAPCPAVLVEMGFLSDATDAARLALPAYQDKLARGIALGISRYDAAVKPR